ncbi:hypothetical protein M011DRAFT_473694 [Sporormia fimetaria CBS 119925]|uniref:Uncharacterized protein n=1 Tax=Sporormia fimetaria CBS 119925 TaxID=1340428 RepID=A0A6A6VN12_9PLEO|nr:hypothetical protein M011DRAFT_473694 [Sporormia fimetaria CBS 119925]
MNVEDMNQQPLHYVTRLAELSRLRDQHFADLSMWHKQYPELNFHDTEKWKDRQVLVCHASLDLMEKQPSGAHLGIQYVLDAHRELGILEPLHCRTRFYDNTERVHDDVKKCDYASDTSYRLPFGSQFWVHRLNKLRKDLLFARSREDHVAARKHESQVQRSLQYMTAIQDIQGTRHDTGEEQPLLTVLWRFTFARTLDGPGRVTWRAVHFPTQAFNSWDGKAEDIEMSEDLGLMPSVYPSLPPELYNVSFQHCLSPLDLESLAHVPMEALNDFSNPASATAPSLATDYSQPQSLLSLAHSQDTHMDQTQDYQDANNIDFHGGSIAIQLGPPIDLDGFETYNDMHAASLHQLSALDPNGQAGSQGFGHFNQLDGGMSVPMTNCYPVKQWHFNDIISRMEGAAENLHSLNLQPHATSVEEHGIVGPGILHSTQLGQDGLWKLQSGFGCEDTHVGAMSNDVHRKERQAQEILELIERDQREAAGRF